MPGGGTDTPAPRAEAVRLYRSSGGRTVTPVAAEIGASTRPLSRWIERAERDEGRAQGPGNGGRDGPRRLRRKNRILQKEKEILKKAALFSARETGPPKRQETAVAV